MWPLAQLARTVFAVRWQPGQDTLVAAATALLMVGFYYANAHSRNPAVNVAWLVGANMCLNVLFPIAYVLYVRRQGLDAVGITARWWWLAALISILWSIRSWPALQAAAMRRPEVDLLPHVVGNGLVFWEPFFVHGWLQLRFERAFGVIPGILLAAACFAAYHVGTYPLEIVQRFFIAVAIHAALFRITRNLLTVWPLTHAITSATGTLRGAFIFDWTADAVRAGLLAVEFAAIAAMAWYARRHRAVTAGSGPGAPAVR